MQNIIKDYPNDKTFYLLLIQKYIKLGLYKKALNEIKHLKSPYLRAYYKYKIYKYLYFAKKISKQQVKKALLDLFYITYYFYLHPPSKKDYKYYEKKINTQKAFRFIFNEALSFGFYGIAKKSVDFVNDLGLRIKFALQNPSFSKTKLFNLLNAYLALKFKESYLIDLVALAYYFEAKPISKERKRYYFQTAYRYVKKYYKLVKTERGFEAVLSMGLKFKNKYLIRYALKRVRNINLLINAYTFLNELEKAAYLALKAKKYRLAARLFMYSKHYSKALYYFLKYGYSKKDEKGVIWLATMLKRYDVVLKILKRDVREGRYDKKTLSYLTFAFLNALKFKEGERFYWMMYKRTKKDIFLKQLFVIYYNLGEIDKLKRIAFLFKSLDLNDALYLSSLFISQKEYKKAYLIMKKSKTKNLIYYQRMYFLATQLRDKRLEKYYLYKLVKVKKDVFYIAKLFKIYRQESLQKAFNFLKRHYIPNGYLLYLLLDTAYKLKKYQFILTFKPKLKKIPPFYYTMLIKVYTHLGKYAKVKEIYKKLFFKYPQFRKDFYWFLISRKDREIGKYIKYIKDERILYQAYFMLGDKKRALAVLRRLALKSGDISVWISYYYMADKKGKFFAFLKIDKMVSKNPKLLLKKEILDFYFFAALKYKSSYEIKRLLRFIKEHKLNYKHYLCIYYDYFKMYKAIKFRCRRVK